MQAEGGINNREGLAFAAARSCKYYKRDGERK